MYQGGKYETETFYYLERLHFYPHHPGGHGNRQLSEQRGAADGGVVLSLDSVYPVLLLAVLRASDRAPLIALYCSYLWRLEHLNGNWNVLMTAPVPVRDVFLGKLMVIFRVTLFTQVWVFFLYIVCGKLCGLPGVAPLDTVLWMLRGTLAAAAIGTLQLLLSMVIRSFAVPIGIALAGSIMGFLFINKGWELYWPYSLMMAGMNSNKSEDILGGNPVPFLGSVAVFFAVFAGAAVLWLKKKDVKAQA